MSFSGLAPSNNPVDIINLPELANVGGAQLQ